MKTNPVKSALKAGKVVLGSEVARIGSAEIPRIYALAGFDFVFIDMEHTPFSLETVAEMVRTARTVGIVPLVRVPQAEYAHVCRVLDAGAQGVIVPRVNTPEQVAEIVRWVRYPPLGIRGFASTFRQTDDTAVDPAAFIDHAHAHTLLVIQIERQQAVDNLEAMLSIDGVDVACLGYMDLSVDLGVPGALDHPKMVASVDRLIEVARRQGVAAGIIAPRFEDVEHWLERGMRFASYATDAILLQNAASDAARRLRALTARE